MPVIHTHSVALVVESRGKTGRTFLQLMSQPTNFNWIKNERRKLETVLMKYPRYKDMFMDVARFISLKFKKRAEIYLAIL